jgi:hypothetical protein
MQAFLAVAGAVCSGSALAHHSIKMIDIASPVWITARIVSYEPRNPHVLIHVEEQRADGTTNALTVEGPILRRLGEMHLAQDFIRPGDVIQLCGFPFKQDVIASNAATPGLQKLPALHAHLLVLPNGQRQPWGPYGKLDNCVRPADTPADWAAFVNAVPMGKEYWCRGLSHSTVPSLATPEFVAEVNHLLRTPCD